MADFQEVLYGIIGKRICELRKRHNDNQEDLAKKIGLKRSTISNIELGKQLISLHWLYRISQVYEVEIYSLLPKVEEVASKVSLAIEDFPTILDQKDVGKKTKKHILEILKLSNEY